MFCVLQQTLSIKEIRKKIIGRASVYGWSFQTKLVQKF